MWPAKLFYVTRESYQGAQLSHPVPINYTRSNCSALTEHSQGCMETAPYPLTPNAFLNAAAEDSDFDAAAQIATGAAT